MKRYQIIVYLVILFVSVNLTYADKIIVDKVVKLHNDESEFNELFYDAIFTENSIIVVSTFEHYLDGNSYALNSLKISEYDFDFKLMNEFKLKNISMEDKEHQFLPFDLSIKNDTLSIIGHYINQNQGNNKYGHRLFALKYYQNKEVYRYVDTSFDSLAASSNNGNKENLTYSINDKYVYTAFKSPKIVVRKYKKSGEYIDNFVLYDDSLSMNINGKKGGVNVKNIHTVNDKIYLFIGINTEYTKKMDYYLNIYDEEFNLLSQKKYFENTSDIDLKIINTGDEELLLFGERYGASSVIENLSTWRIFKIMNDSLEKSDNNLGINYPDEVYDFVKFDDGYIAVGSHTQVGLSPYQVPFVQKMGLDFKVSESYILKNSVSYDNNFAVKIKVINSNDYIIVGSVPNDNSFFLNKISIITSVEKNDNLDLRIIPNPSNDFISIPNLNNNTKYTIVDILGNEIITGYYFDKIDVSNLTRGHFFLKLYVNNDSKTIKFIKN